MMYRVLVKVIPKKIKNFFLKNYKEEVINEYSKYLIKIKTKQLQLPHFNLLEKHINNLKVLENRERLLDFLPKGCIVAELGVDIGDFSELIIKKTKPKKIHLIDTWDTERYSDLKKSLVYKKFKKEVERNLMEINIGYSVEVLKNFNDNYFDWIYIDTDHSYETTKSELELASKKVKNNGIICGHDYYMGNWITGYKYGVIEAVQEFCVVHNYEIIYLTIEQSIPPSFAIRKIEV